MGVSTYVVGVRDLDEKFNLMFELKEKCNEADVSYPEEVTEYFNNSPLADYEWGDMEKDEMATHMGEVDLSYDLRITSGDVEYGDGLSFDLSDLPDDIKSIRVYMN